MAISNSPGRLQLLLPAEEERNIWSELLAAARAAVSTEASHSYLLLFLGLGLLTGRQDRVKQRTRMCTTERNAEHTRTHTEAKVGGTERLDGAETRWELEF